MNCTTVRNWDYSHVRFKHALKGQVRLEYFMQEQVKLRREEIRGHAAGEYKRKDAFSMLVQANESDENAKNKLTDRELVSEETARVRNTTSYNRFQRQIGNMFIMLFAGHGRSIAFSRALDLEFNISQKQPRIRSRLP